MEHFNQRKNTRLQGYDYSRNGVYFVTICVEGRHEMLGRIVGAGSTRPYMEYSEYGIITQKWLRSLPTRYATCKIDNYIIMPNHLHILVRISDSQIISDGRVDPAPTTGNVTLSSILGYFKYQTTKDIGIRDFWQRSFYDQIIRSDDEYRHCYKYINENPSKWIDDDYYISQEGGTAMPDLIYWIWLSRLQGLRVTAALRNVAHFRDLRRLYEASERELREVRDASNGDIHALMNKSLIEDEAIIENCKRLNVNILTLASERYPERLANIYDPPLVLYVKGNLPDFDAECSIGIVGTRRASQYGLVSAERIAFECAECGALIVTGLAEGIDSAAARGALRGSGRCVGVLGTGIDIIFPRDNDRLFAEVEQSCCLISEYPPGERASRYTFPARNRIISGLSLGVCIVEAPERSGSLITASHASDQGRDVFVVPGSIDLQGFRGSNALLRDGAELVTCGWDIVSRHEWRFPGKIVEPRSPRPPRQRSSAPPPPNPVAELREPVAVEAIPEPKPVIIEKPRPEGLSDDESAVLDALVGKRTADSITSNTGLRPERVMVALTLLELKGLAKNIGNMMYEAA